MSRAKDPHRAFLPLGNPFRMILTKGSCLSPEVQALLNKFEENLAQRLRKLMPEHKDDVISFSWMILAMQLLSETHDDIKSLITELELPVYDWDDKWIDVYLDNTVKLLDICIAFCSELSRLSQGQLLLHCVLHNLNQNSSAEFLKAESSMESWVKHIGSRNPRIENCFPIIDKLMESLELPKVKNSPNEKVLMRAMYAVKVQTLFICQILISAFTNSDKNLIDLQVSETYLWVETFSDLQTFINNEIRNLVSSGRNILLKDLEEVDISINKLRPMIENGGEPVMTELFSDSVLDLGKRTDKFSSGLDLLTKEVDRFFQIVLSGRDALLANLRVSNGVCDPPKKYKMEEQLVR